MREYLSALHHYACNVRAYSTLYISDSVTQDEDELEDKSVDVAVLPNAVGELLALFQMYRR